MDSRPYFRLLKDRENSSAVGTFPELDLLKESEKLAGEALAEPKPGEMALVIMLNLPFFFDDAASTGGRRNEPEPPLAAIARVWDVTMLDWDR